MIEVTRLNEKTIMINCELIESVEETPDTVITFNHGKKLVVKEDIEEIKHKIIEYKQEIFKHLL